MGTWLGCEHDQILNGHVHLNKKQLELPIDVGTDYIPLIHFASYHLCSSVRETYLRNKTRMLPGEENCVKKTLHVSEEINGDILPHTRYCPSN